MKILMIGGTGIISSEICKLSIAKGYEVTILNRGQRKKFINSQANLVKADWRNEDVDVLKNKINKYGDFDIVIDFISYNTNHLKKSIDILNGRIKQFIFISTATAYIDKQGVYKEESEIGNREWGYSYDKSECEWYLQSHKLDFDFKYTIIRPYVTYGVTRIPYQIAPLEYYTIINRIINKKPIPICGVNTKCTLTNASDFAVGAVGLYLNEKAYGEAVHITSNNVTTWKRVIELIGDYTGYKPIIIDLDKDWLIKNKSKIHIDVEEVLGDKARDMVFDNSKIKRLSPNFEGKIDIETGIKATLEFYQNNPEYCKVNYVWDAIVDNMLDQYKREHRQCIERINLSSYEEYIPINVKLKYIFNRYTILSRLYIILKKLKPRR